MSGGAKAALIIGGVVVVGGGVAAFVIMRRRKAIQDTSTVPAMQAAAVAPGAVVAGLPMSPRVAAKKKHGGFFSRVRGAALKGAHLGVKVGALAGAPGAAQAQALGV